MCVCVCVCIRKEDKLFRVEGDVELSTLRDRDGKERAHGMSCIHDNALLSLFLVFGACVCMRAQLAASALRVVLFAFTVAHKRVRLCQQTGRSVLGTAALLEGSMLTRVRGAKISPCFWVCRWPCTGVSHDRVYTHPRRHRGRTYY